MTDPNPAADSESYIPPAYVPLARNLSEPSTPLLPSAQPVGPQAVPAAAADNTETQPLSMSPVVPVPASSHVAVNVGSNHNPRVDPKDVTSASTKGTCTKTAASSASGLGEAGSPSQISAGQEEGDASAHIISHTHFSHRSPWLRAFLLGANDGLVSTASLMIGVGAVQESQSSMIVSGLAGLVAGACSMAIGEYISVFGQRDTEEADLRTEAAEFAKGPEACAAEMRELAGIYEERGLTPELALMVAEQLHARDPVRAHARDELGIDTEALSRPGQAAAVSALAFSAGALIPLLAGAFVRSYPVRLGVIIGVSSAAFVLLGMVGAWLGGARMWKAALRTAVGGWIAMGITFGVLRAFGTAGI